MWIHRDISSFLQTNQDLIQIIMGPRQVGKSTLLEKLSPDFSYITLDSLPMRELAQNDPDHFLSQWGNQKLLIDEAQYAPQLFHALKKKTDEYKKNHSHKQTLYRLTGSNQILMDRAVKEGLTGRASYFRLNTCSYSELQPHTESPEDVLYQGGWPELYAYQSTNPKKYLDDYITSYVEKDIILTAGIQKSQAFLKFLRLLSGHVGQILNQSKLAQLVGSHSKTINEWISILERMQIITLLPAYSSTSTKG